MLVERPDSPKVPGWYDRRVADGDVPENIRSITGWKKAMREFMSKDAKLNDVVMLFTQKFVQMGQSKNFALSTLMDLAWTVLIITWEAVVDQKLPRVNELEQGYKMRYQELQKQLFTLRGEFLKEITQARDERRKRQAPGMQVALNEIGAMEDNEVFRFIPEDALDPETREYFKAAIAEQLKVAITRGAAAAGEDVKKMAKELHTKDQECRELKGKVDTLETKVETLEIELQDSDLIKPPAERPVIQGRRSASNTRREREREGSKAQNQDELKAMLNQLEAAKQEEAKLLEKVNMFKGIFNNVGIDADNLSGDQLQQITQEKLDRKTQNQDSEDAAGGQGARVQRPTRSAVASPVPTTGATPDKPTVNPEQLQVAEAQVEKLKNQQNTLEADKKQLTTKVVNLEKEVERLAKDLKSQKEETATAVREAGKNAKTSKQPVEEGPEPKTGRPKKPADGADSRSAEKPQKPPEREKKKTGLPPPDSAPAVDTKIVEKLEGKVKSLEEQVKTLQAELQLAKAAAQEATAKVAGLQAESRKTPASEDSHIKGDAATEPKVVVKEDAALAKSKRATSKAIEQAHAAEKESLEQTLGAVRGRVSTLEKQLEEATAVAAAKEQELLEKNQALKERLEEATLRQQVMEEAMGPLNEKFSEMRAKLTEKGVDVSVFDDTVRETGMTAIVNQVQVFDRLYKDAVERRKGYAERRKKRLKLAAQKLEREKKRAKRTRSHGRVGELGMAESESEDVSSEGETSLSDYDTEEADGDAAAGGGAGRSSKRGFKGICPVCGWSAASGNPAAPLQHWQQQHPQHLQHQQHQPQLQQLHPLQQSHQQPTGGAWAFESGPEQGGPELPPGWNNPLNSKDRAAGSPVPVQGGISPGYFQNNTFSAFQPFPERSPSRRKVTQCPGSGGGVSGAAGTPGTSPVVERHYGRGTVAVPPTGFGRSHAVPGLWDAAAHEDALALIVGSRDSTGVSIVGATGDPGSLGARPGSSDSGSGYDLEAWRSSSAQSLTRPVAKDSGGQPANRRPGTSEKFFVQAGLQQFGMSKALPGLTSGGILFSGATPMHVHGLSQPRGPGTDNVLPEDVGRMLDPAWTSSPSISGAGRRRELIGRSYSSSNLLSQQRVSSGDQAQLPAGVGGGTVQDSLQAVRQHTAIVGAGLHKEGPGDAAHGDGSGELDNAAAQGAWELPRSPARSVSKAGALPYPLSTQLLPSTAEGENGPWVQASNLVLVSAPDEAGGILSRADTPGSRRRAGSPSNKPGFGDLPKVVGGNAEKSLGGGIPNILAWSLDSNGFAVASKASSMHPKGINCAEELSGQELVDQQPRSTAQLTMSTIGRGTMKDAHSLPIFPANLAPLIVSPTADEKQKVSPRRVGSTSKLTKQRADSPSNLLPSKSEPAPFHPSSHSPQERIRTGKTNLTIHRPAVPTCSHDIIVMGITKGRGAN